MLLTNRRVYLSMGCDDFIVSVMHPSSFACIFLSYCVYLDVFVDLRPSMRTVALSACHPEFGVPGGRIVGDLHNFSNSSDSDVIARPTISDASVFEEDCAA